MSDGARLSAPRKIASAALDMPATEQAIWAELTASGGADHLRDLKADVWAEIAICLQLAQAAKRRPYGALITSAPPPPAIGTRLGGSVDAQELRRAAEGRTLLICRCPGVPVHLLQLAGPLHTDIDCAALLAAAPGVVLRADAGGRICVVGPRSITSVAGRELWTRPHTGDIAAALRAAAPGADGPTLDAVVGLAYSHVSPARIGATLVYQLTMRDYDAGYFSGAALETLGMNVNDPAHLRGILHQLKYRDGALVFGRTGTLRRAGVILVGSPAAVDAVGVVAGGTRHHSAAWHSYDRPDVLCFVVSSAGRVTLFSLGQDVTPARLPGGPAERD